MKCFQAPNNSKPDNNPTWLLSDSISSFTIAKTPFFCGKICAARGVTHKRVEPRADRQQRIGWSAEGLRLGMGPGRACTTTLCSLVGTVVTATATEE